MAQNRVWNGAFGAAKAVIARPSTHQGGQDWRRGRRRLLLRNLSPRQRGQVRLVDSDSSYKKVATTAQGERLRAYLDTGSAHNIIAHDCVRRLAHCVVQPVSTILKGFGGGTVLGVGQVALTIIVDYVNLDIDVGMVDSEMAGADILLGEPALSKEGTILTVRDGKAMLSRPDELIRAISLEMGDVKKEKLCVRLKHDEVVAPGTASEVAVRVEDASPRNSVFVQA